MFNAKEEFIKKDAYSDASPGQIKDKMNKLLDEAVENTFGSNRDLVDLRL